MCWNASLICIEQQSCVRNKNMLKSKLWLYGQEREKDNY